MKGYERLDLTWNAVTLKSDSHRKHEHHITPFICKWGMTSFTEYFAWEFVLV